MASKKANENYIHNCGNDKVKIDNYIKSILRMGFSDIQLKNIINFYLCNTPMLKNDKNDSPFGLKTLKSYGWVGNQLSKLEGKLLKAANIGNFILIKSDRIDETLKNMDLSEKICIEHPRAVLKQNFSVTVKENGTANISETETRMECLFRHIRNPIAHNHTYCFDNGNIILEDRDEKGIISAVILMPKQALLEWIDIVDTKNICGITKGEEDVNNVKEEIAASCENIENN